jgi:hypothetical protein
MKISILSVVVLAPILSFSISSNADELRYFSDPFVGKPALAVMPPVRVDRTPPVVPWNLDSSVGKPPAPFVLDGPPPRSKGIGLRFDTERLFYVYTDANASPNHFAPSGWMGDYGDIVLDVNNHEDPADGADCLKVTYRARGAQGFHWAGMYWQEPANNWGHLKGGFDLTGTRYVTFWARGAQGGEQISEFKVGGIRGNNPDSTQVSIGPIVLSSDWKMYVIDLTGADLSKISGGFAWAASRFDNPDGMTFYLDEIRYQK